MLLFIIKIISFQFIINCILHILFIVKIIIKSINIVILIQKIMVNRYQYKFIK